MVEEIENAVHIPLLTNAGKAKAMIGAIQQNQQA